MGCTLGCIYAIDFLLLETSRLDCVENAECADMMECGEHLAKVVMSSARRLCVLARLSNNIHAHMCVYIELAQNHFLSHLSVVAFCLVTRFDSQEV